MAKSLATYDESKIQTLSSLEHIRLRSGMYIGRLGDGSNHDDGIYILVKEVIDNAVDEFIMGYGKKIYININDNLVSVRDFGRGIPLGKVIECVSVINTGAKYNDDVFQFSVGLNGVGTKAVNALSSHFLVRSHRQRKYFEAVFQQGVMVSQKEGTTNEPDGTLVEFKPDFTIFSNYSFNFEYLQKRLWTYACLNPGLQLFLNNEKFEASKGLLDFLNSEVGDKIFYPILHYRSDKLEFALTHYDAYGETYWSFVNGQYTSDGGTHLSAFREGILKGINSYFNADFNGLDVREGIAGAISIKLKNPVFESQTKNKLGNTDIRGALVSEVKQAMENLLHKNQESARVVKERILYNEKLRKELAEVKKEAKQIAKKAAIKIPSLKDCKYHLGDGPHGEKSMIFLTEGQSASGSMVSSRDPLYQAIFSLRGKPQNMYNHKKGDIYKNEELCYLMMALGIENDVEGLRYNQIIIATDADYDGFHIRNLLLTFFLEYFEELVVKGKVYILETPLFRVRNKKETRYCYSEKERDLAIKDLDNPEVTRFKGLGEISPKEFAQFIDPATMKLIEVTLKNVKNIKTMLKFYMGDNTPERRDYIMENLI
jgi:topoisomerase-4 subunit B